MKPEYVSPEQQAVAYLAWKRGEEVEYWSIHYEKWCPFSSNVPIPPGYTLRLKPKPPEPKWRQWNPEEVPVGMGVIRLPGADCWHLIIGVEEGTLYAGRGFTAGLNYAFNALEWRMLGSHRWSKCGVLEP